MAKLTFMGGIHPYDGKDLSKDKPMKAVLPKGDLVYPLSQHIGAPAVPVVAKGDHVLTGQKIAEAQGFVSAPIYATVSGTVKAIEPHRVVTGDNVMSIVIEDDHLYEEAEFVPADLETLSREEIIGRVKEAGIVGMGGAAFPTNVKLDTSKLEEKPDTLIVNGSECEPYLTSDHRIMVENAEQIVDGIVLAMKASGVSCAKVGIEDNKPDAIAAMREAASDKQNVEVVSLPARYPQGFEKTLIYSLTGRIVPNGKLPSAAKCVVMNVGTCAALSAAVRKGQPLIDRVVTVTGRVAKPTNFRVRIGTPLLDLIDQVGGLTDGVRKLIVGGAMMGNAVSTLNLPITKNFGGFLALGEEAISAQESACIRCGRCMRACPMKLAPAKIDSLVRHGDYDGAIAAGAMNCMECGSCTYACPAKRELTQSCRVAKAIARTKAKKS